MAANVTVAELAADVQRTGVSATPAHVVLAEASAQITSSATAAAANVVLVEAEALVQTGSPVTPNPASVSLAELQVVVASGQRPSRTGLWAARADRLVPVYDYASVDGAL